MRVNNVYISGIGVSLGDPVKTEDAIAEGLYDEDSYRISKITQTHVAGDVPAVTMAVDAAKEALSRAGAGIDDVDTLIHVGSPQQGPGGEIVPLYGYVLRELGGDDIHATEIRQGCNGLCGAIDAAVGYLTGAAGFTTALITAGENYSTPLIDRWHFGPDMILGDGGTALVLSSKNGFAELVSVTTSTLPEFEEWHRGDEPLLPQQDTEFRPSDMGDRVAGFAAKGMSIPEIIERWASFFVDVCYRSLAEADINSSDIVMLIPNNTDGRQYEQLLLGPLDIPLSRSSVEFGRTIGHIGSADQAIAFEHFVRTGRFSPGDYVMFASSGPGVIATSIILRITDIPTWLER